MNNVGQEQDNTYCVNLLCNLLKIKTDRVFRG